MSKVLRGMLSRAIALRSSKRVLLYLYTFYRNLQILSDINNRRITEYIIEIN
jgi:hypothetical protein|nr:MAG TPA: hypothetical protein [Caudoviricetes sp.]